MGEQLCRHASYASFSFDFSQLDRQLDSCGNYLRRPAEPLRLGSFRVYFSP